MTDHQLFNDDARILTPEDWQAFDALIVDPPYSAHVHDNATSNGYAGAGVVERDLGFASLTPELAAAIAVGASNVKRWSAVFSDIEGADVWRDAAAGAGAEYVRTVPWVRWSQPQLSGDRPPSGCELVPIFHRQKIGARGGRSPLKKHWNGPGSLTHFARRCLRGRDKHPTEKPLDLMLDLVSWFSDPGESVVDPCAGAGTTVLAARLLGRSGFGFETDGKWAGRAARRVSGPLSARDHARAVEWVQATIEEASSVPEPKAADGSDVKTWERAQRRLADAERVRGCL